MKKPNLHIGSNFDDFLKEEGIFEEVQAKALKRVSRANSGKHECCQNFESKNGRANVHEPFAARSRA
jgi:hypothetical protein